MKSIINRYFIVVLAVTVSSPLSAATKPTALEAALNWTVNNIVLVMGGLVVIGAFATLAKLVGDLLQQQKMLYMKEEMEAELLAKENEPSFFQKMYKKAWNLVPMEKEADIDLGHSFDGIHELDNKLPPWWVYLFYITIIWGGIYLYMSHYSENSQSQNEIYYAEMEVAKEAQREFLRKQANAIDESNVAFLDDVASLESGKKTFITNCMACHAADGGGTVGPNLTDEYWIHGGSMSDVFKTIKYGVPQKGMISWKTQLPPSTMQKVASYIMTLQGTTPLVPKKAEGVKYEPELTMNEGDN